MDSESHFEESIEERSESYEHTESSMSLYEGHSELYLKNTLNTLFPFKRSLTTQQISRMNYR